MCFFLRRAEEGEGKGRMGFRVLGRAGYADRVMTRVAALDEGGFFLLVF